MFRTCLRAAGAALVLTCAVMAPLHAQPAALGEQLRGLEPDRVRLALGAFEVFRGSQREDLEIGGEVQLTPLRLRLFGRDLPPLSPVVGGIATEATTLYGYAGLRFDLWQSGPWALSPSAAAGLYWAADGKRLGGVVEFRTAVELSRELGGGRLGLCYYHLSNSRLYATNPGTESLILSFSAPLRRR